MSNTTNITTIETVGRRHYLRGLPYAHKDIARAAGCKWDPDQRCWWTGRTDIAAEVAEAANAAEESARIARGAAASAAKAAGLRPARPAKLTSGDWGARVEGDEPSPGDAIRITTAAGKSWDTTVEAVERADGDGWLVATPPRKGSGRRPPNRYRQPYYFEGRGWSDHPWGDDL